MSEQELLDQEALDKLIEYELSEFNKLINEVNLEEDEKEAFKERINSITGQLNTIQENKNKRINLMANNELVLKEIDDLIELMKKISATDNPCVIDAFLVETKSLLCSMLNIYAELNFNNKEDLDFETVLEKVIVKSLRDRLEQYIEIDSLDEYKYPIKEQFKKK